MRSRTFEGCGTSLGTDHIHAYGSQVSEGLSHIGMMKKCMNASYLTQLKNDGAEAFVRMWEASEHLGAQ